MSETQISAYISPATKRELERYADAHGVKKGHLLEEALLHHLQALRELPPDLLIPPRVVVSQKSLEAIGRRIRKPGRPNKALRDLMQGKRVRGEPADW
jgi:hypothetical protein